MIKFKEVKRGRKKKKSEKVNKEVMDKNLTERKINRERDIIYKGENDNENFFEVKIRNAVSNRPIEDDNYKKQKRSQNQRAITKRTEI